MATPIISFLKNIGDPRKVRRRVLSLFALVYIAVAILATNTLTERETRERDLRRGEIDRAIAASYVQFSTERGRALAMALDGLAAMKALPALLAENDRVGFLEKAAPAYQALNHRYGVTHFYLHAKDQTNLARVHYPPRHGDRINRHSLKEAARTRTTAQAVELGPMGTLTLRVVRPVNANDTPLGFLELGIEIGDFAHSLQQTLGLQSFIVLDKKHLDRTRWEQSASFTDHSARWDLHPRLAVGTESGITNPNLITRALASRLNGHHNTFEHQGRVLWTHVLDLHDPSLGAIGHLVALEDITDSITTEREQTVGLMMALAALGALLFFVSYLLLGHAQQTLVNFQTRIVAETARHREEERRTLEELTLEHQRLDQAQALAKLGSWVWDRAADMIWFSDTAEDILFQGAGGHGLTHEDLIQRFVPQDQPRVRRMLDDCQNGKETSAQECRVNGNEPAPRTVILRVEATTDGAGETIGMIGTLQDVTHERQQQAQAQRLQEVFQHSWNEFYIFDAETLLFEQVSPGGQRNSGYSMDELRAMTPVDIKPDFTEAAFRALIAPLLEGDKKNLTFETRHRRKDGSVYPVEVRLSLSSGHNHSVFLAIIQDITEREDHMAELERKALFDDLTNLPNRTLLLDRITHEMDVARRNNSSFALVAFNILRMREMNDILGHKTGDSVIKEVAKRLTASIRDSDTVARFQGDEFCLVLGGADKDAAEQAVNNVRRALEMPLEVADTQFYLSFAAGICLYPDHGEDATTLIRHADIAMNVAKHEKQTFAIYQSKDNPFSLERLTLLSNLREAVREKAFVLYYQPKVDIRTGALHSVEALIRWPHPDGMVSPADFIPLAEQTGLIAPITDMVLDHATRQAADWAAKGHHIPIAVNISARNLLDRTLPEKIHTITTRHGIAPSMLVGEVTESAVMDHPEVAMAILNELADMGIRISIDDYGTGYSSLAYIRALPVSELKIDQCFVRNIHESEDDRTIVRSTVSMAHELGLTVIAEGVETDQILKVLDGLNCDVAQGYHFAKPMPADALEAWLAKRPSNT